MWVESLAKIIGRREERNYKYGYQSKSDTIHFIEYKYADFKKSNI